ncbi:MAG: hypothetical protein FWB99_06810 [Treponema sp.]|nr:hypothetical protein [Treponema sp.]
MEALPDRAEETGDAGGIIEEREGVHYINEEALKSGKGPALRLNLDFKNLVDSILK